MIDLNNVSFNLKKRLKRFGSRKKFKNLYFIIINIPAAISKYAVEVAWTNGIGFYKKLWVEFGVRFSIQKKFVKGLID